ncbi:hypothetical protein KC19_8G030500 [Ceratodon purpureus]|uniref:Protein root UVB sensitive 1, chloroplastic n=1 Tax=Ceratodon purpureus TaxID=3225 RepID=A0A8T0GXZ0_CERPU|nr:hypothetical protein KC19_8G030500 [Ceratodon purpureus]
MELCVRMQVNSASPACYLQNGFGCSGRRRPRGSVSGFGRIQRRGSAVVSSRKERFWCRIEAPQGAASVDYLRSSNVAGEAHLSTVRGGRIVTGAGEDVVYEANCAGGSGDGGSGDGRSGGGGGGDGDKGGDDGSLPDHNVLGLLLAFCGVSSASEGIQKWYRMPAAALAGLALLLLQQQAALALSGAKEEARTGVWEVKGGRWKYLVKHPERDEFVVATVKNSEEEALAYEEELVARQKGETVNGDAKEAGRQNGVKLGVENVVTRFVELSKQLLLPDGYPRSVTDDYMEYTLWRMGQVIASQISGVLTTQALLYAVGLGKGAIPTAAAVNWVLRDGIGYLSKIVLSKYGRHFDVHPKGWRLVSDVIENMSYGLELLTPTFPHLFVYLAAAAGAGRSAAGLIQAATKSCFNAGMAANRNFAEVIAKGEAQGMVSKSVGIALGIAVSAYVGSTGPLLVSTFFGVTALHIFCNLKSYQAVQLRTLNPYRASLVLAEYFRSGNVVSLREVNGEEPIFPKISFFNVRLRGSKGEGTSLSEESKAVAHAIEDHLEFGATFGAAVKTREEADALLDIYKSERYLLSQHDDRLLVVLKEGATPRDMLRAMMQAIYLNHLQGTGFTSQRSLIHDSGNGGVLRVSHDFMAQKFDQIRQDIGAAGWICEGLVARPAPNRLLESAPSSTPIAA